jgi:hypothetical protein
VDDGKSVAALLRKPPESHSYTAAARSSRNISIWICSASAIETAIERRINAPIARAHGQNLGVREKNRSRR